MIALKNTDKIQCSVSYSYSVDWYDKKIHNSRKRPNSASNLIKVTRVVYVTFFFDPASPCCSNPVVLRLFPTGPIRSHSAAFVVSYTNVASKRRTEAGVTHNRRTTAARTVENPTRADTTQAVLVCCSQCVRKNKTAKRTQAGAKWRRIASFEEIST